MDRGELLYEGKAKQVYATPDPDLLIQHFKDDATAFNAKKRGTIVDKGILNNFYKDDALDDPMINDWHIRFLRLATPQELSVINETALRVNALLREYLDKRGIVLVDMKLEFGRHHGKMLLADEICPDTCR